MYLEALNEVVAMIIWKSTHIAAVFILLVYVSGIAIVE